MNAHKLVDSIHSYFSVHVLQCSWQLAPTQSASLVNSMKIVQNPVATCDLVYTLIQSLTSQIRKRMEDPKSAGEQKKKKRVSPQNVEEVIFS